MKKKHNNLPKTELRRQAEAEWSERKKRTGPLPATELDVRRLVHELQVHQIELEMQNEELMQARAELEAALRQYTDLYDFAPVGYFTLARDGAIRQVNLTGANLLGVERGKLIRRRFGVFVSAQSLSTFNTFLEKVFESQRKETCEVELQRDGPVPLWVRVEAISDSSREQHEECHTVVRDVTERKQAEEALKKSEVLYHDLVESSQDLIWQCDAEGRYTYLNSAWEQVFDYKIGEMLGKMFTDFQTSEYAERDMKVFTLLLKGETVKKLETVHIGKDGREIHLVFNANLIVDEKGNAAGTRGTAYDITERKQAEKELKHLSTHDVLTGLYNRSFFMEEMARLERGREFPIRIVMADVDCLKETNDHHGHAAGDALLKRVAQVLTAAYRAEDVVARIGGDEFAVLLPATDATAAEVALQRVRQVIRENNAAHPGTPIRLSLGVSTAERPASLSNILKEADENMYRDKQENHAVS